TRRSSDLGKVKKLTNDHGLQVHNSYQQQIGGDPKVGLYTYIGKQRKSCGITLRQSGIFKLFCHSLKCSNARVYNMDKNCNTHLNPAYFRNNRYYQESMNCGFALTRWSEHSQNTF